MGTAMGGKGCLRDSGRDDREGAPCHLLGPPMRSSQWRASKRRLPTPEATAHRMRTQYTRPEWTSAYMPKLSAATSTPPASPSVPAEVAHERQPRRRGHQAENRRQTAHSSLSKKPFSQSQFTHLSSSPYHPNTLISRRVLSIVT